MAAFEIHFMALAIDVIDKCSPSNKMRRKLQPKKTKVRLYNKYYLAFYIAAKDV